MKEQYFSMTYPSDLRNNSNFTLYPGYFVYEATALFYENLLINEVTILLYDAQSDN